MKAPAHFHQLQAACLPLIQAYHADLLKHDRRIIRANPTCPFLHVTRDYGTYITMLPPADSPAYPPDGVEVPYLFGKAGRHHILREKLGCMKYARQHHPNALVHYFDGSALKAITYDQADRILTTYQSAILTAWQASAMRQAA